MLRLIGVWAGGDSTSCSAYRIAIAIKCATDGNRAAIAVAGIGCFADAIVGTRALRGSHLSHASSNLEIGRASCRERV